MALFLFAALLGRAQFTEVPETVKPGHWLMEMDAMSLAIDRSPGTDTQTEAITVASTLFTTGLTDHVDVQIGADFFLTQHYKTAGVGERHSGRGDVYLRAKWNVYADEATGRAIALLPYVKIPTNTGQVGNRHGEGGLIVPVSTTLPGGYVLYAMGEWDWLRNGADDGYESWWSASATVSQEVTKRVGLYVETVLSKSEESTAWTSVLGAGATLTVTDDFSLDYAIYRGLSRDATDWNHVLRINFSF